MMYLLPNKKQWKKLSFVSRLSVIVAYITIVYFLVVFVSNFVKVTFPENKQGPLFGIRPSSINPDDFLTIYARNKAANQRESICIELDEVSPPQFIKPVVKSDSIFWKYKLDKNILGLYSNSGIFLKKERHSIRVAFRDQPFGDPLVFIVDPSATIT